MPADTPVTVLVDVFTVATDRSLLVQVPPLVALFRTLVFPSQAFVVPVMAAGPVATVTKVVVVHPLAVVYVIVEVPAATGYTTPVDEVIVAFDVALLLHVPPSTSALSVDVVPVHTVVLPVIPEAFGYTVNVADALQPFATV